MKDILRVKNLNKSYKNFSLTDVSFSLSEGCITVFIGINGAGKTTTLRTILNLAKKDSLCICSAQVLPTRPVLRHCPLVSYVPLPVLGNASVPVLNRSQGILLSII